jgi:hypothetical protein
VPVGKTGQGGICFWEPERILKKYPNETKNVKVIVISLEHFTYGNVQYSKKHPHLMQKGNSFHFLKDLTDLSLSNIMFLFRVCNNEDIKKKPIFLPVRFSLRSIADSKKNADIDKNYNHIERMTLKRYCTNEMKKNIETMIMKNGDDPNIQRHLGSYSEDFDCDIRGLLTYCRSKGIFVIATIPPVRYKCHPYKPDGELTESDHRFLALISFLEKQPNGKVLYLKNFHGIIPDVDDSELLIDHMHTTAKGATVYTNWLADQMLKDPKIMTALKKPHKPRKPEEFFVKKYAKKGYRKIAGYFKKKTITDVKVAQPPNNPVR